MSTQPLMTAVALEAVIRKYVEMIQTKGSDERYSSVGPAGLAASVTQYTCRVVLALQQLLQGSTSSGFGDVLAQSVSHEQHQQLMFVLASLLLTCLKAASAMGPAAGLQDPAAYLRHSSLGLNTAAVAADLGCQLGDLAMSQQAQWVAAQMGGAAQSSSSHSQSNVAMWPYLVSRSLLLLSDISLQAYAIMGQAWLGDVRLMLCADEFLKSAVPLGQMASMSLTILKWLKGQLLGTAWLSKIVSTTGNSTSSAAMSAMVADRQVL